MDETKSKENQIVRAGSTTYFLDVKETKTGKPYLAITESHFQGEGVQRQRKTISVFHEHIPKFIEALNTIAGRIQQSN